MPDHPAQTKIIADIRNECTSKITLNPEAARRFFKVSEGSYGAGDEFLGITAPDLRKIAKTYKDIELEIIAALLQSKYNEERLLALLILVHQYQNGDSDHQQRVYQFYLNKLDRINNWNLVDSSAHHILGHYLWNKDDRSLLSKLAASTTLWERRIAIVATWYFIRKSELELTFKLARLLQNDPHDLIHKAVGWMLREAGKKDEAQLVSFLSDYGKQMPRTMLRYAMERLTKEQQLAIRAK